MDLPKEFNKIFPFDYLTEEEKIDFATEFINLCIAQLAKKKQEKQEYLELKKLALSGSYESIILAKPEEKDIFNELVGEQIAQMAGLDTVSIDVISGINAGQLNILSMQNYPFLYLVDRHLPFISGAGFQLQEVIEDPNDFIKYCFNEQGQLFPRDTMGDIDIKLNNINNYLDKFLYCMEEYLERNIVCVSNSWEFQEQSKVLVSVSVPNKRFILDRPTMLLFEFEGSWYEIMYLDLVSKKQQSYGEMGLPNVMRLKRLLELETEKVVRTDLYVSYEPSDIGKKLPKIELSINNKTYEFLVGLTYNLYMAATPGEKSTLVGRIDIINAPNEEGMGQANIKWVEGYPGLLK